MFAYLTAIATLIGVRALLTLGLNVQWGLTGLVNLGVVAFFAVGAYTSALLAAVKGVPTERVIALATLGGGGLAGGAGVFLGLDASIDPLMGGGLIISVFAAAILGGIGSAPGALAGALIVGIMEEVGMLVVPPTYKTAIGFTIILAVLLVRPTGLAGARS